MSKSLAALAASFWLVLGSASLAEDKALPTTTIVIDTDHGPHAFRVEIAADPASQERGLMFRKAMAPDAGMIFEFPRPAMEYFWMKNTILPLDIIFIRANGTISSIAPDAVPYSTTTIPSMEPVRAVLELNGGRAAQLGIEPDQVVHHAFFGNALANQPR
ncbi:MAG TPA: DUF192 domain-containing protein [Rhizomicrobium sp.]|nr:DUF192 domain-containing protein [Rhizomicrobium sp.]